MSNTNVPARGGQRCVAGLTDLQSSGHEYRAAHEQEDDQAGEPLLSDAQEARLLSWSRALRLQLQAVDVRDGQHGGRYEPGQAHDGAHRQHHPDHEQVQVVPTALLHYREENRCMTELQSAAGGIRAEIQVHQAAVLTSSLCSLRLMMTAVICWSMKMRMVQRRAGIDAARTVHQGLRPIGLINQPLSSLVGWRITLKRSEAMIQT